MAVYNEIFPAREWDYAHADGLSDREVGTSWEYRPRIVTLNGRDYSTTQKKLDLVASGAARFEESKASIVYVGDTGHRAYLVTYEGATLADREENWPDDSDWYALVWDGSAVRSTTYATTRGGGTEHNYVKIDPTPEVLEAVRAYAAERNYESLRAAESAAWHEAACAAVSPSEVGARVRVVRGRKVPHGLEGTVFWAGERTYSQSRWAIPETRVGLRTDGETIWIAATNLERIVDPDDIPALETYRAPEDELRARARANAEYTWAERGARIAPRVLA